MDDFSSDDFAAILAALIVQEASLKRAFRSASSSNVKDAYSLELDYVSGLMSRVRKHIK